MPLGDSITVGYTDSWYVVPYTSGWRRPLFDALSPAHAGDFTFVGASPQPWDGTAGDPMTNAVAATTYLQSLGQDNHRGYAGQTLSFLLAGAKSWIESDRPDVVLLHAGINDIAPGASAEPTTAEANLYALVKLILDTRPKCIVVVAQVFPPVTPSPAFALYNAYIRNTLVPAFVAQGRDVRTVDNYSAFLNGNPEGTAALYSNGINHPDAAGYARLASSWLGVVSALF